MVSLEGSESSKTLSDAGEGESVPNFLLTETDALASTLSEEELVQVLEVGGFPPETVATLPEPDERADARYEGWICFYTYPFRIGHKFPFSSLVQDFLATLSLAPCQVMPQAWRVLRVLDLVNAQTGAGFDFGALWYNYFIGSKSSSRVQLRVRRGRKALVASPDVNDRGWGSKFFFVKRSSLEKEGECPFLLTDWRIDSMYLFSFSCVYVFLTLCS